MSTFTAQQLIDRAAALADMKDGFISPQTWLDWLNDERQALDLFVAQNGWVQEVASATNSNFPWAISVGTPTPPFPLAILGVWEVSSSNKYRRLKLASPIEGLRQDPGTGTTTGPAITYSVYRTSGSDALTINFFPRPTSGTYICYFIPLNTDLTSVSQTLNYPMRWEKLIILNMALQALIAEDSDTTKIEKLISRQMGLIEKACWDRMMGDVPAVRNSDETNRGWLDEVNYSSPSGWFWV